VRGDATRVPGDIDSAQLIASLYDSATGSIFHLQEEAWNGWCKMCDNSGKCVMVKCSDVRRDVSSDAPKCFSCNSEGKCAKLSCCGNTNDRPDTLMSAFAKDLAPTRSQLIRLIGTVSGAPGTPQVVVQPLVDCGASQDFVSATLVDDLKLPTVEAKAMSVALANGKVLVSNQEAVLTLALEGTPNSVTQTRHFRILDLGDLDVVLGKPWLHDNDPHVGFRQNAVSLVHDGKATQLATYNPTVNTERRQRTLHNTKKGKLVEQVSHETFAALLDKDARIASGKIPLNGYTMWVTRIDGKHMTKTLAAHREAHGIHDGTTSNTEFIIDGESTNDKGCKKTRRRRNQQKTSWAHLKPNRETPQYVCTVSPIEKILNMTDPEVGGVPVGIPKTRDKPVETTTALDVPRDDTPAVNTDNTTPTMHRNGSDIVYTYPDGTRTIHVNGNPFHVVTDVTQSAVWGTLGASGARNYANEACDTSKKGSQAPGNVESARTAERTDIDDDDDDETGHAGKAATAKEIDENLNSGTSADSKFPDDCKAAIRKFLLDHPSLTMNVNVGEGKRTVDGVDVEHSITETPGSRPPNLQAFRMSPKEVELLQETLQELLRKKVIRPSSSPYGAPIMFVPKPDGSMRMVIDYRMLNNQTVKDNFGLPRDTDLFDQLQLHEARYITSIDLKDGYYQVRMKKEDVHKTSIVTPVGSYEFEFMPMGLANAPSSFQRMMTAVLAPVLAKSAMVYLDDIIVYSRTAADHLRDVTEVLSLLHKHNLRIKLSKCEFFRKKLTFLGHVIEIHDEEKITLAPNPEKIAALNGFGTPTSSKDVERFLGLANYYARLIPNYAHIAAPLMSLTNKGHKGADFAAHWTQDCVIAQATLKQSLSKAPVVCLPDPKLPWIIQSDASNRALGGMLLQRTTDGQSRVISYFSHKWTSAEANYPTHEKELMGLVWALKKFRHYLVGAKIKYEGDHKPLKWIKTQVNLSQRQMRWLEVLESFDWEFNYIPGENLPADGLSRPTEVGEAFFNYLAGQEYGTDAIDERVTPIFESNELPSFAGKLFTTDRLRHFIRKSYESDEWSTNTIRNPDEHHTIVDGIIYRKGKRYEFNAIVIPRTEKSNLLRNLIMREYHDVATGAHLGPKKMYERLRRHFVWKQLEDDVKEYVKGCVACRRAKRSTVKPPGRPQLTPVPERAFGELAFDWKSMPMSKNGYDQYLVVVDRLTRYAHIVPCKKKDGTQTLVDAFFDVVVRRWGWPTVMYSDRDSIVTSEFWQQLTKAANVRLNTTTSYRPNSDGMSERLIQTVTGMMRARAVVDDSSWDEWIAAAEFAYNDCVHPATGYTPFQLATGRDPLLPVSVLMESMQRDNTIRKEADRLDASTYLKRYAAAISNAKQTLQKVNHAQRQTLMSRVSRQVEYEPGDYAYVNRIKPKNMEPLRDGPYRIIERVGINTYRLEFDDNRHPVVNEERMSPYFDRDTGLTFPVNENARGKGWSNYRDKKWNDNWYRAELQSLLEPQGFKAGDRYNRQPTILELCAGPNTPAAKALRRRYPNARIITVDIDPKTFPTIVADVVTWKNRNLPWPPGSIDIVWASPPCTEYSFAKTVGDRNFERADAIVSACLRIIEHVKPRLAWFLENPKGLLKDRPFMKPYEKYRNECTYCKYDKTPYKKPTHIWSNRTISLLHCDTHPCDAKRKTGSHPATAQGGPTESGKPGTPRHKAYETPPSLMDYLMEVALQYEQRRDNTDWQLRRRVYNEILSRYIPAGHDPRNHYVELFSNEFNRISNRGYTVNDNAFSYTWTGHDFYGNPPYLNHVIYKTLEKALTDHKTAPATTSFVFVLPRWTSAAWYALVQQFDIVPSIPQALYCSHANLQTRTTT